MTETATLNMPGGFVVSQLERVTVGQALVVQFDPEAIVVQSPKAVEAQLVIEGPEAGAARDV